MNDIWPLYLLLGAFPALIVFAAIYKFFEVMQASRWSTIPGRVVVSTSEAREVSRGDASSNDTELRTFAKIEYEYTIAGRAYRGSRVSIGEDLGNFEVAETIARYPVGRPVTVFYNPNKRDQAVLERDVPPGLWKAIIIIVLVLVGLIVGGVVGFGKLADFLGNVVSNPSEAPFVTACLGFAAFASLIVYAIQKNAAQARAWPTATGKIESSDVHEFQSHDSDRNRSRTQYRAEVVYSYQVAGVRYTSDKLGSAQISASTDALARRASARYPAGSIIQVHYNPANPSEAIVNPGGRGLLLLWLLPLGMVILAYVVAR